MIQSIARKAGSITLSVALLSLASFPARADVILWNSAEGEWDATTTSVWDPSTAVPGSGDDVRINNGGLATLVEDAAVKTVTLGQVATSGNRLTINADVELSTTGNIVAGSPSGSEGTLLVNGQIDAGGLIYIGHVGSGTLTVGANGSTSSTGLGIGQNAGSSGTVYISGGVTTSGVVTVGSSGNGNLTLYSGGSITSSGATIGNTGTGIATVSGLWTYTGANLTVGGGNGGSGTLLIESGGEVKGGNIVNIGNSSGSTGQVTVSNGGKLTSTNGAFNVGNNGNGTLLIESGGEVSSTVANIGVVSGSEGTATVYGKWTSGGQFYVGSRSSGASGKGTLTIKTGGSATGTAAYIGGGNGSTVGEGTVTVEDGGTWEVTSLQVGVFAKGTLNIEEGGKVTSTSGSIGESAGSNGSAVIDGEWDIAGSSNDLTIGNNAAGTLRIGDGGLVKNRYGYVGRAATGDGSVVIESGGVWQNSGFLRIGTTGKGALLVENGGGVSSAGDATIGFSTGTGEGDVHVRGTWTIAGGNVAVAYGGKGVLTIGGGGLVNVDGGAGTVYLAQSHNNAQGALNIGGAVTGGTPESPESAGRLNAAIINGRTTAVTTPQLNFNHTNDDYRFENTAGTGIVIEGNVVLNHYAGTTFLTAASTYTGGTQLYGGTLVAGNTSGSATGSGDVGIHAGATLRGSGTIAGAIILNASGILGAGESAQGELSASDLVWNGGGTISLRLGGTELVADRIELNGTLTKGTAGAYLFDFGDIDDGPQLGVTYGLIGYGSLDPAWDEGDFSFTYSGGGPGFNGYFTLNSTDQVLEFTVTTIPEPGTTCLWLGAALLAGWRIRSRRGVRG